MTTFIALYRGRTVGEARLIGVSAEPELVSLAAAQMLSSANDEQDESDRDPVLNALGGGRRQALKLIGNSRAK